MCWFLVSEVNINVYLPFPPCPIPLTCRTNSQSDSDHHRPHDQESYEVRHALSDCTIPDDLSVEGAEPPAVKAGRLECSRASDVLDNTSKDSRNLLPKGGDGGQESGLRQHMSSYASKLAPLEDEGAREKDMKREASSSSCSSTGPFPCSTTPKEFFFSDQDGKILRGDSRASSLNVSLCSYSLNQLLVHFPDDHFLGLTPLDF